MSELIKLSEQHLGMRLDAALSLCCPDLSRNDIQKHIEQGRVQMDGRIITENKFKIKNIDVIVSLDPIPVRDLSFLAENIPLSILYEDDALMIINKPCGLIVHPGAGHSHGTLMNALLHYHPEANQLPRAGIVHRLDKDTSGIMVVAKTMVSHQRLIIMMQKRKIKRHYWAIAHLQLKTKQTVDAPIGRHPNHRQKMCVIHSGKPAVTHFTPIELFSNATLIDCELESGRTHQIRVHLHHIKHGIVSDPLYRQKHTQSFPISRQALHAYQLSFPHPLTRKAIEMTCPMPDDMKNLLNELRANVST